MIRRMLVILLLFAAGTGVIRAQDRPDLDVDSLSTRPQAMPPMWFSIPQRIRMPELLNPEQDIFETREQRALKEDIRAAAQVAESVSNNLNANKIELTKGRKAALFAIAYAARLFLSNPFGIPDGYVPLMNANNPFLIAKIPGSAPYFNPYSPEQFPQCIKTEYDPLTNTYRQVMVDWKEYEKSMKMRFDYARSYEAVPAIPVTPVERMMSGH
ncbi:MAG: hypothetical protein Q4F39_01695 [Bacteroidia bacterium]|nr:hypothetical protein [Bacteroidia bacterium]